jgi:hypothetical protein
MCRKIRTLLIDIALSSVRRGSDGVRSVPNSIPNYEERRRNHIGRTNLVEDMERRQEEREKRTVIITSRRLDRF